VLQVYIDIERIVKTFYIAKKIKEIKGGIPRKIPRN
jgi:hypothetical protein